MPKHKVKQADHDTWVYIFPGTGEDMVKEKTFDKVEQKIQGWEGRLTKKEQEYEEALATYANIHTSQIYEARQYRIAINHDDPDTAKEMIEVFNMNRDRILGDLSQEMKEMKSSASESMKQTQTTIDFYMGSYRDLENADVQKSFRLEVLQGAGVENMNPWQMDKTTAIKPRSGLMKSSSTLLAQGLGIVAGAGEKQNIRLCMEQLAKAARQNNLPDRIMLNGHSRGACSAIELAREIYLTYGDNIKISMNINDPVPGPGRHSVSKKVIPPNVDSLIITYAGNESGKLFIPLDGKAISFDPAKTTVTTIVMPYTHVFVTPKNINPLDCIDTIKYINDKVWEAVNDIKTTVKPSVHTLDQNWIGKGTRQNSELIFTSDPKANIELPDNLKHLHQSLQNNLYDLQNLPKQSKEKIQRSSLEYVTATTKGIDTSSRQGKEQMLDTIYRSSQKANYLTTSTDFLNEPAFKEWETNYSNDAFEKACDQAIIELHQHLMPLRIRNNNPQDNQSARIAMIEHSINIIKELKNANAPAAEIYHSLKELRENIIAKSPELTGSSFKARTAKIFSASLSSKSRDILLDNIDKLLSPLANQPKLAQYVEVDVESEKKITPREPRL